MSQPWYCTTGPLWLLSRHALHKSRGCHLHYSLFCTKICRNPETTSNSYTLVLLNCFSPSPAMYSGLVVGLNYVCVCVCVHACTCVYVFKEGEKKGEEERKRERRGETERQTGGRKGREMRHATDHNKIFCVWSFKRLLTRKIIL